jgi:hypothetical protein
MIKRLLWLGVGIAVGAVVARQVSRTIQAYSPSSLAGSARNSAADLWESVRDYVADVREGMAEKEEEIRFAFEHGVSLEDLQSRQEVADDQLGHDGRRVRFDDLDDL